PKGADVQRDIAPEPEQTETRRIEVYKKEIPLATVQIGWKTTNYTDDDHYALGLLGDVLGSGRTSRLDKLLVNSANPLCNNANVGPSDKPITPRRISFPNGNPTQPPLAEVPAAKAFEKGVETAVNGVKVITLTDNRLPLVNWSLVMRAGSDAEPKGKEGLGG